MIAQRGVQDPLDGACVTAREEHGLASNFAQRNDLHGRIGDGAQKPIQRRSVPQQFPAGSRALPEDDVGDALTLRDPSNVVMAI